MDEDAFVGLDEQLCFAVYAASHAFTAAYKPLLEPYGLTYPQFIVLVALWEKDGRNVKELSERLHLDSGTLTPLLKRMEAAGHLRRQRNPKDERHLLVELTESGRALRPIVGEIRKAMICALGGREGAVVALTREVATVAERLRTAPRPRTASAEVKPRP